MGQEASVPVNHDDLLEEQARAPPSHTLEGDTSIGGNRAGLSAGQSNRSSRKIMGAMFRQSNNNIGNTSNYGAASHNNQFDYEQREASRAAALGGHIYMNEGSSDDFVNGNSSNDQQHQQQQLHTIVSHPHEHGTQQSLPEQPQTPVTVVQQSHGMHQHQSVVGVLFEKQSSAKKGLFSSRGTRGVINTMRNLTLTGTIRKQKEVSNWEKQWDEDDDDSEDDDADSDGAGVDARKSSPQHGVGEHYVMDAGACPASPMKLPSTTSPPQQSALNQSGLEYGESVLTPIAVQPNLLSSDLQQHHITASDSGNDMPISPPRIQHQHLSLAPVSPPSSIIVQGSQVEDLLSKPNNSIDSQVEQRQQYVVEDGHLEWDNDVQHPPGIDDPREKPNVQMFMPMLRVLGKGSFGKVNSVTSWLWL
jgi:hypothetical protein